MPPHLQKTVLRIHKLFENTGPDTLQMMLRCRSSKKHGITLHRFCFETFPNDHWRQSSTFLPTLKETNVQKPDLLTRLNVHRCAAVRYLPPSCLLHTTITLANGHQIGILVGTGNTHTHARIQRHKQKPVLKLCDAMTHTALWWQQQQVGLGASSSATLVMLKNYEM